MIKELPFLVSNDFQFSALLHQLTTAPSYDLLESLLLKYEYESFTSDSACSVYFYIKALLENYDPIASPRMLTVIDKFKNMFHSITLNLYMKNIDIDGLRLFFNKHPGSFYFLMEQLRSCEYVDVLHETQYLIRFYCKDITLVKESEYILEQFMINN